MAASCFLVCAAPFSVIVDGIQIDSDEVRCRSLYTMIATTAHSESPDIRSGLYYHPKTNARSLLHEQIGELIHAKLGQAVCIRDNVQYPNNPNLVS